MHTTQLSSSSPSLPGLGSRIDATSVAGKRPSWTGTACSACWRAGGQGAEPEGPSDKGALACRPAADARDGEGVLSFQEEPSPGAAEDVRSAVTAGECTPPKNASSGRRGALAATGSAAGSSKGTTAGRARAATGSRGCCTGDGASGFCTR